jgi:hypothetical protein
VTEKKGLGIYLDELCPEFCPLRHLLVYLAATKLQKGYLFPVWNDKQKNSTNGIRPYDYGVFRNKLRTLIFACCDSIMRAVPPTDQPEEDLDEAEKDPLIGTHTLRKTGYLFAVWSTLTFNGALSGSSIVRPPVPTDNDVGTSH